MIRPRWKGSFLPSEVTGSGASKAKTQVVSRDYDGADLSLEIASVDEGWYDLRLSQPPLRWFKMVWVAQ